MSKVLRIVWHCDRCGHEWFAKAKPPQCIKCGSYQWDERPVPLDEPEIIVDERDLKPKPQKKSESPKSSDVLRRWREKK